MTERVEWRDSGIEGFEALRKGSGHLELGTISEQNRAAHAHALAWTAQLDLPHAVVWVDRAGVADGAAARLAVQTLFAAEGFPVPYPPTDLELLRDPLGKPFMHWQGAVKRWAMGNGREAHRLQITNTHDGGAHIILAAYHEELAGIGIDTVYLPRLRTPGKDTAYLRRFAKQFMSDKEQERFERVATEDNVEELRLRVAAHFSLMEAASKALGTGLKIGGGMGGPTSLPKQSLGVGVLSPTVELLFEAPALQRMAELGATHSTAYWSADHDFLISVVLLWISPGSGSCHAPDCRSV